MAKTPQEIGKEIEEEFRLFLKFLMEKRAVAFLRLYDTHSAGSYLPDQPGDFIATVRGHTHLIEMKSSEVHDSLAAGLSDLLSKEQATHHRLWARAGATTHIIFVQQLTGAVEVWDGKYVGETKHATRKRLDRTKCLRYGSMMAFKEAALSGLALDNRWGARTILGE